jgi:cytoskeletal protein RodZ
MRKGYLSFLAVAMVIASIMIAGCTTSNQANQASSSETSNATTTAAAKTTTAVATTTSSSVASASPTVTPLPSTSPTATPTPTTSPKIATSIQFASNPSVRKGQSLGINVISSASGLRICAPGLVTATIGTVTSGGSDCYYTAYLDTSSLNPGTYDVTLKFAGDGTNQLSQSTTKITITA